LPERISVLDNKSVLVELSLRTRSGIVAHKQYTGAYLKAT
jgi:hypothetical protein